MGYQTGVANSVYDLLDKFRLFAGDEGWTINRWTGGNELCIQKGTQFYNFRAFNQETVNINGSNGSNRFGIGLNGSDGYAGGNAWDNQPGRPVRTVSGDTQGIAFVPTLLNEGPFPSYHFFAPDAKTLYCTFEIVTGTFLHFGCGALDLYNPAAPGGGRFFFGSCARYPSTSFTSSNTFWNRTIDDSLYAWEMVPGRAADYTTTSNLPGSFLRAAFGSFDGWCHSARTNSNSLTAAAWQGAGVHDKPLYQLSPSPRNRVGILSPNVAAVNRGDEFLQPVGVFPGYRLMRMDDYLPGDEFTFGGDTWMVFPWYAKGGKSYERAIALLKSGA